jgi:glycosyl transferase family 25
MLPTYVISLPEEKARHEHITAHLEQRGFEPVFVDGIDKRGSNVLDHPAYDFKRRRAAHGRDLKSGELGCFLAHRAALQRMLDDGHDCALILEDDASLHENTLATLQSLLNKNIEFDLIRLLGSDKVNKGKHRKITPLYKDHALVRLRTNYGGAHATLYARKGAQKLLAATQHFAFPWDTALGRCWETGLNAYSILPGLAVQDTGFESTIGDARFSKAETPKALGFKITRAAFKIEEALGKAWVYWSSLPKDLAITKKFG